MRAPLSDDLPFFQAKLLNGLNSLKDQTFRLLLILTPRLDYTDNIFACQQGNKQADRPCLGIPSPKALIQPGFWLFNVRFPVKCDILENARIEQVKLRAPQPPGRVVFLLENLD